MSSRKWVAIASLVLLIATIQCAAGRRTTKMEGNYTTRTSKLMEGNYSKISEETKKNINSMIGDIKKKEGNYSALSLYGRIVEAIEFTVPQNYARAQVGELPLVWDLKVESYAQWWADQRRQDCQMIHSHGPYGENIFWGGGQEWRPSDAVKLWVDEKYYYDYDTNSCSAGDEECGHYTQIIWRDTQRVGCARVVCDNGDVFMTCNYDPPGNYIGQKPY